MLISNVKPDLNSIVHFFDHQHHFYTKIFVYFTKNNQRLRAELLFPFHKRSHFTLDTLEIYHHDQWTNKKGDPQLYGMALADHSIIALLDKTIANIEANEKNKLEKKFRRVVSELAARLAEELKSYGLIDFEISADYLNILIKVEKNGGVCAVQIETNYYFSQSVNEEELIEEIAQQNVVKIIQNLEKHTEAKENQKIFVTTIPLLNPISEEEYKTDILEVSIQSAGQCPSCDGAVFSSQSSPININLRSLESHIDDLLIMVVDEPLVCNECQTSVKKERILIKDLQANKPLAERFIDDLVLLGTLGDHEELQRVLTAAVEHRHFFHRFEESFWSAYSFVALRKWDVYIEELTRKELWHALQNFYPQVPKNISKEKLLSRVKQLGLTEEEKGIFWMKANETVIRHYLLLTVFGWAVKKEIGLLGQNRAQFIFQYLPIPTELKPFYEKHASIFTDKGIHEAVKLQKTIDRQHEFLKQLQQENGRLTEKLGESYKRISELEQSTATITHEFRSKTDILKIQQLKGLIEELKFELDQIPQHQVEADEQKEGIVLSEEPLHQEEPVSLETILQGKSILILGGYRAKQTREENGYIIQTHDARILDPTFYELVRQADVIIVLTRFISHRAMWEAKEYAILEEKPIHFTAFTNIPTILTEIVSLKIVQPS